MKRIVVAFIALIMAFGLFAGLNEPAQALSQAPVAENMEFSTYRNVSFGGQLNAYSPEGQVLSYIITTEPIKGSIELNEDGSFVYTPRANKKGRDYFGYKAVDTQGRSSQEGTVIIRIEKQKNGFAYSDMQGRAEEYSAVILSEAGIFTGEKIGADYCFYPDRIVSRGEFVAMCMQLEDAVLQGAVSTGYTDDEEIPSWLKPYALTAAMSGIDMGNATEDGVAFAPEHGISPAEAARVLNSVVGLTDVSYLNLNDSLDAGTAQACAKLSACGIIKEGQLINEQLSRAEAAVMLAKALEIVNNR
ncbi:MAG: hypothetical protein IJB78_06375 [Oscillospiraceae bacterium]|nr:hypothetical protein [Oscillospiraceae bacterium]